MEHLAYEEKPRSGAVWAQVCARTRQIAAIRVNSGGSLFFQAGCVTFFMHGFSVAICLPVAQLNRLAADRTWNVRSIFGGGCHQS